MRSVRIQCPRCGRYNTQEVSTEWFSNTIDEFRVCIDCEIEFVNKYNLLTKSIMETDE
jgi:transposase-like protein